MKKNFIASRLIFIGVFIQLVGFTTSSAGLDNDVLKYTNQFRKSQGRSVLAENKELDDLARQHSEDMAHGRVGYGHAGFNQRFERARQSIKGIRTFAENVAYGVTSGKAAVSMWKGSPGHRQNLLGNFRYIGVGTARDRKGVIYYTQIFAN